MMINEYQISDKKIFMGDSTLIIAFVHQESSGAGLIKNSMLIECSESTERLLLDCSYSMIASV